MDDLLSVLNDCDSKNGSFHYCWQFFSIVLGFSGIERELHWQGSDDWIRSKFLEYMECFLSTVSCIPNILDPDVSLDSVDICEWFSFLSVQTDIIRPWKASAAEFNSNWLKQWVKTHSFRKWAKTVARDISADQPVRFLFAFLFLLRLLLTENLCRHPGGPSPAFTAGLLKTQMESIGSSISTKLASTFADVFTALKSKQTTTREGTGWCEKSEKDSSEWIAELKGSWHCMSFLTFQLHSSRFQCNCKRFSSSASALFVVALDCRRWQD